MTCPIHSSTKNKLREKTNVKLLTFTPLHEGSLIFQKPEESNNYSFVNVFVEHLSEEEDYEEDRNRPLSSEDSQNHDPMKLMIEL